MREIRELRSVEYVARVVDRIVDRFGGIDKAIEEWVAVYRDPEVAASYKLKCAITWMHMYRLADETELAVRKEEDAAGFVRRLHAEGRLRPILSRMFDDGVLTFDDMDPPPESS